MKPEDFKGIVHSDPEIMGGTPVFVGTRVPLQNLIDCLEGWRIGEGFSRSLSNCKARASHCGDRVIYNQITQTAGASRPS